LAWSKYVCWSASVRRVGAAVVGNEIEQVSRIVILGIEKVFEIVWFHPSSQSHPDGLHVWLHLFHGDHNLVTRTRVCLHAHVMLVLELVGHLPLGNRILIFPLVNPSSLMRNAG